MNAVSREAPERQEIEALLPWHAAGTLNRRDSERVERAIAADRELARVQIYGSWEIDPACGKLQSWMLACRSFQHGRFRRRPQHIPSFSRCWLYSCDPRWRLPRLCGSIFILRISRCAIRLGMGLQALRMQIPAVAIVGSIDAIIPMQARRRRCTGRRPALIRRRPGDAGMARQHDRCRH